MTRGGARERAGRHAGPTPHPRTVRKGFRLSAEEALALQNLVETTGERESDLLRRAITLACKRPRTVPQRDEERGAFYEGNGAVTKLVRLTEEEVRVLEGVVGTRGPHTVSSFMRESVKLLWKGQKVKAVRP